MIRLIVLEKKIKLLEQSIFGKKITNDSKKTPWPYIIYVSPVLGTDREEVFRGLVLLSSFSFFEGRLSKNV